MKRFVKASILFAAAISMASFQGCTNLDEDLFEDITSDNFFSTEEDYYSVLVNCYGRMRPWLWSYFNVSQVSSDETMVPTRGGDWGDGGVWRELHQHNWGTTNGHIVGLWNDANAGLAQTHAFLGVLETADDALFSQYSKAQLKAEARVLRAYYYFQLMDCFGGVPILEEGKNIDPSNLPARNSRAEVYSFIESELNAAIPDLAAGHTADQYGRVTKNSAHGLLARLYLNAEVYSGTAQWGKVVEHADAIINSGVHSLPANYFDNFVVDNHTSPENIFVVPNTQSGGMGLTINMRTMHYNQLPASPWNGFCTIAEFYNTFDHANDIRDSIFLIGQQYDFFTGAALTDRQGNPLDFTLNAPITGATESNGVRVMKWQVDAAQNGGDAGNDYAIVRYADVLLMKAEALVRQGNAADALPLVNQVRARAGVPALSSVDADAILLERGFELAWEAVRRMDLIRYGKFNDAWTNKDASPAYTKLFPIPASALGANPNLEQNPGY